MITNTRHEDIINVPEIAEAEEVQEIAIQLLHTKDILYLRNQENRAYSVVNTLLTNSIENLLIKIKTYKLSYTLGWFTAFLGWIYVSILLIP